MYIRTNWCKYKLYFKLILSDFASYAGLFLQAIVEPREIYRWPYISKQYEPLSGMSFHIAEKEYSYENVIIFSNAGKNWSVED